MKLVEIAINFMTSSFKEIILFSLDCSTTLDRSETRCLEDDAIFHCSSIQGGTTVMSWQVTSTCGSRNYRTSFSSTSTVGQTRDVTLCSTTLMFTVTSLTSSSISVTLTIHTPVLLNGTRVTCEDQSQTMKLIPCKLKKKTDFCFIYKVKNSGLSGCVIFNCAKLKAIIITLDA